nr:MAG TPA: hypothetical protein [Caudoviricetes sp.]
MTAANGHPRVNRCRLINFSIKNIIANLTP